MVTLHFVMVNVHTSNLYIDLKELPLSLDDRGIVVDVDINKLLITLQDSG